MSVNKLLLLFNPKSGREEFVLNLFEVVDRLTKSGFEVTVRPTQGQGDGYDFVRRRGRHFTHLVCSGGDGTISEAINALMHLDKRPVFGYIPSGTTNDFASTLGIPKDILQATNTVIHGKPHTVDIGRFQDNFFTYVAAFGLFTDVTYATPQNMKNILGHAAYILEGAKRLTSIHTHNCVIEMNGGEISGEFILGLVSNATSIGGFKIPGEETAVLDDGLFEVLLVRKPKSLADMQNVISALLGREYKTGSIILAKASRVRVLSKEPLPWTLDGEYGGDTTDVTLQNHTRALTILVPDESEGEEGSGAPDA